MSASPTTETLASSPHHGTQRPNPRRAHGSAHHGEGVDLGFERRDCILRIVGPALIASDRYFVPALRPCAHWRAALKETESQALGLRLSNQDAAIRLLALGQYVADQPSDQRKDERPVHQASDKSLGLNRFDRRQRLMVRLHDYRAVDDNLFPYDNRTDVV
jgi:hypothetical protein